MLNRATSSLHDDDDSAGLLGMPWQVDQYPLLRLALLFAVIVFPLGIVGWRIAQLQFETAPMYVAEFSRLTEQVEEISILDGRILTSDGQAAAQDVPGLQVQIHYRWIEEPPDPRWLSQKVSARLTRSERRQPERVAREREKVLAEREILWSQLAEATGIPLDELRARCRAIQNRITRMKKRVSAKRAAIAARPAAPAPAPTNWRESVQQWFVEFAMQPPAEKPLEEIVLKEELSYYPVIEFPRVEDQVLSLWAQLKSHPEMYPNLRVMHVTRREYPLGSWAAHVVGYRKALTQEEWQLRREQLPAGDPLGYQPGDRVGKTGVEKFYERHLRCLRGQRKLWLNSQGEVVKEEVIRAPRPGRDLELTLNYNLQLAAEEMLSAAVEPKSTPVATTDETSSETAATTTATPPQSGCIAVMDVRTGELLVAAAWPTFNIDLYLNGKPEQRQLIEADRRNPLYPRLHKMMLAPGSVFKALTATAMLQSGVIGSAPFYCQGYLDSPNKRRCMPFVRSGVGHGEVDLSMALAQSCNVYFFHGAREMGAKRLLATSHDFGFGQPTGIDLPYESSGNLPKVPCDHLGVAIGQAALTVTPLQIVRMMAAIANGGELLTPHVVRQTGAQGLSSDQDPATLRLQSGRVASRSIPDLPTHFLEEVRQGLEQVVASPRGTGYKTVRLGEVRIAGKTGTAEARGGQDHAWFSGYVPADQPRYAFVVVLERGGAGGKVAGPLARKLVQAMLQEGLLPSTQQLTQAQATPPH